MSIIAQLTADKFYLDIPDEQAMRTSPVVRTLVVTNSLRVQLALLSYLSIDSLYYVVYEASSAAITLSLVEDAVFDLVLLDLSVPRMMGTEITHRLKSRPNTTRVILLTRDDKYQRAMLKKQRADGFVHRALLTTELLSLIHELFENAESSFTHN